MNYWVNNTVYSTSYPVGMFGYGGGAWMIANNISTDNFWGDYVLVDPLSYNNLTFRNNMYYGIGGFMLGNDAETWAQWQTLGTGFDSIGSTFQSGDPLFTDGSGNYSLATDFMLQPSSPAINAGVNVGLTTDYAGNPIVGLPDIGAYEYVDTTPPASPTGLIVQ